MTKISVNYYYLFLFIFLINVVNAQTNTIKVTYKAFPLGGRLEDDEIIKKSKYKHLYEGLDNALASLQFCLVANKEQSHFYLEDGLAINERAKRMAINFTTKDNVFINLSSKLFVKKKNIVDNNYYVSWDLEPKWKLIDEKKSLMVICVLRQ